MSKNTRVVITGLGVCSPIGTGLKAFKAGLKKGISGIRYHEILERQNYRCHIGGLPLLEQKQIDAFTKQYGLVKMKGTGIIYGCMAGLEAWYDAGLELLPGKSSQAAWDYGCIFGTCTNGIDAIDYGISLVDTGNVRKMGGRTAQQAMNSGVSAYLGGIIGIGNQLTTNSSSCITGVEAALEGFNRIREGKSSIVLVGSAESSHHNVWGGYDGMTLYDDFYALAKGYNDRPEKGSCPMSTGANGLVPGSGGGAMVLESLKSAQKRGARIYGELLGGSLICGAQRAGGTMTINNRQSMEDVIGFALEAAKIRPDEIDLVSGHLPSYIMDVYEVQALAGALKRKGNDFPYINALKSMTGHCFAASSSLELIATALQLKDQFIHPTLNAAQLDPEIAAIVPKSKVPLKAIKRKLNIVAKTSYGFGDVAGCVMVKRWSEVVK